MRKLIPFVNIFVLILIAIVWPLGAAVALYVPALIGDAVRTDIGNFYQVIWGFGGNLSATMIVGFVMLSVGSLLVIPAFIPMKLQRVILIVIAVFFVASGVIFLLLPTLYKSVNDTMLTIKLGGSVIAMSVLLIVGGAVEAAMVIFANK